MAGFATPARADEAAEIALGREIIELSGGLDQLEAMLEPLRPMIIAQVSQAGNLTPAEGQRLGALLLEEIVATKPQMLEVMARAYAEQFDEIQLREMRAFYASPTGQALRAALPAVMRASETELRGHGEQAALRALQRFISERAGQRSR